MIKEMARKQKLWAFLMTLGLVIFVGVFCGESVSAKYGSYTACLNASGGREDIASVKWACNAEQGNGANSCALWIGGDNSKSTTITVETNKTSGSIGIKFWGMCTQAKNKTKNIWVFDDNGSISDSANLNRGKWAHPTSKNTTLNISKFISGAKACPSKNWGGEICKHDIKVGSKVYTEYKRKVTVKRQNGAAASCKSWSTACSSMKETVKLRILKGGNLTVQDKNIYDNRNIKKWSAGYDADWKKVLRDYKGDDKSPKKFIGWKVTSDHAVKGTDHIIERTSSKVNGKTYATYLDSSSISDEDVVYYKTNSKKRIYSKLNANLSGGDKTVWAYYAPICKLTIDNASGTRVTVERTGGSYGIRKVLSNNSNIFRGDKLKISASKNASTSGAMTLYVKSSTMKKKSWNSGSTYTVSGKEKSKCENVTVSTKITPPGCTGNCCPGQPCNENSDETELKLEQKNARIDEYSEYQTGDVFAKPGDKIDYRATYYSGAQSAHGEVKDRVKVGGQILKNSGNLSIGRVWSSWDNGFSVGNLWTQNFSFTKGLVETAERTDSYAVGNNDVGARKIEEASTSTNTPKKVEFGTMKEGNGSVTFTFAGENMDPVAISVDGTTLSSNCFSGGSGSVTLKSNCLSGFKEGSHSVHIEYENDRGAGLSKTMSVTFGPGGDSQTYTLATIDTSTIRSSVGVKVPYNFVTTTSINDNGEESIAFAGEDKSVTVNVGLDGKDNSITDAFYTTKAREVKKRLVVYPARDLTGREGGTIDGNVDICSGFFGISGCIYEDETVSEMNPTSSSSSVLPGSGVLIWYKGSGGRLEVKNGNPDAANPKQAKTALIDNKQIGECLYDDFGAANIDSGCLNSLSVGKHQFKLVTENDKQTCNVNTLEDCGIDVYDLFVLETGSSSSEERKFNVPDYDAGSYVCVAMAVFPTDSGEDDNMSPSGYTNAWRISNSKCFKIAKKPSLQVWGGNVYSSGNIKAAYADKKKTAFYNNEHVFGSWAELGVISGGKVTNFGSGASLGYESINANGDLWPSFHPENGLGNNEFISRGGPGGNTDKNFCLWSPLTFSNTDCSSRTGGEMPAMKGNAISSIDKDSVIKKLFSGDDSKGCSSNAGDISGADSCYYSSGDLVVGGAIIEPGEGGEEIGDPSEGGNEGNEEEYYSDDDVNETDEGGEDDAAGDESGGAQAGEDDGIAGVGSFEIFGTIKRIHAKGNITISGNIGYSKDGYESLAQIPKIVIYAEGDIAIECEVGEIDALLIAEGTVKTCGNSDNVNSRKNSNQLKIFGAVLANKLEANRTYGAATGANSVVPAEIINFDPSLYLWNKAAEDYDETVTGGLEAVTVVEVAPRR